MKNKVALVVMLMMSLRGLALPLDTTTLKTKPVFGKQARVITYLLENNHYRKIHFDDSLSSVVLDSYLKELDNSKLYFLLSDVRSMEKYRQKLDDLVRVENVNPAFDIFGIFRDRYRARIREVINIECVRNFDFSIDEYYDNDRDSVTWATSEAELNETWRKIIKSQALNLKLTGKKQEEISDILKKRYERLLKSFDQLNSDDIFSIYMNCITEAYDPHTNYLSPKATDIFKQQMSLSLEGIGARLQLDNDYTKVFEIIPGGPADKSGQLHANDLIVGVGQGADGEIVDVVGWRLDDVVKLIKGPKGTKVRLQVLPVQTGMNGPSVTMEFTRDKVKLEDLAAKKKTINYSFNGRSMKLGVISLPSFYMDFDAYQKGDKNYRSTTRDVKKLILELQAEGIDGLIMDLRNNGGGSLPEAVELTGLFIKDGPVVQVKNSADNVDVMIDDDKGVAYAGPLVVLTNRSSASASEIFAGAIQDYHRGIIAGESTYGKGTVQVAIDLDRFISDSEKVGELKLTYQKFYRVTGSSTQHKGVTPDIIFPSALAPEQYGESANPSALPWDVIKKTDFLRAPDITDKVIAGLTRDYQERLKFDPLLKKYVGEVDDMKKNLTQTTISLNEAKRKKEMEEAEKRKLASESLDTKITSKEGTVPDDLVKLKDEYLREGLLILSDMVNKRIG